MEEMFPFPKEYHGTAKDEIIARLITLQEAQNYLIVRVNKINGSIKELYLRTDQNKEELIRHAGSCPMRDRVEELNALFIPTRSDPEKISTLNEKVASLELVIKEQVSERKANGRWVRGLQPILLGVVAAILSTVATLALLHANSFIKDAPASPPAVFYQDKP